MDQVNFELVPAGGNYADELNQIRIKVNDTDLIELVREVELPSARADEEEELAGTYVGLVPGYIRIDLASQFLGGTGTAISPDAKGKTALLSCDCGEVGCSPLLARVTVTEDTVTWDDFEQPTRPDWDYDDFGPFTFARSDYEQALLGLFS
ncbi:MAG: hypothetical protein QOD14_1052 [Solirubrobacterales bacterium]|jgi:hypothetical protein|nr:hypothetical protein [Solirubrobacterales bacterium]